MSKPALNRSGGKHLRKPVSPQVSALSEQEQTFVAEYATKSLRRGARRAPALIDKNTPGLPTLTTPDPAKPTALFWAQLAEATGSFHSEAKRELFTELYLVCENESGSGSADALSGALAHMLDIGPRDGLEGLLAVQMVSVHRVAMRLLGRSGKGSGRLDVDAHRLNHASRLLRLFAMQADTLHRCRGKAPTEQRVTVEHVHVHAGGQAVVGYVSPAQRLGEPARPVEGGGGSANVP